MLKLSAIGFVGKTPRFTKTGDTKVLAFSLGTTRSIGKGKTKTSWTEVRLWGDYAEAMSPYIKKGRGLYVEGRPEATAFINKKEEAVGTLTLHADQVEFLGANPDKDEASEAAAE
jgi:single-strand DNA-binding protein